MVIALQLPFRFPMKSRQGITRRLDKIAERWFKFT
jgi:hypothetical protein